MKTKNRFSVVKVKNGKWKVFDAHKCTYILEWPTRQAARVYADNQNQKEYLRTAEVVSFEPNTPEARNRD